MSPRDQGPHLSAHSHDIGDIIGLDEYLVNLKKELIKYPEIKMEPKEEVLKEIAKEEPKKKTFKEKITGK